MKYPQHDSIPLGRLTNRTSVVDVVTFTYNGDKKRFELCAPAPDETVREFAWVLNPESSGNLRAWYTRSMVEDLPSARLVLTTRPFLLVEAESGSPKTPKFVIAGLKADEFDQWRREHLPDWGMDSRKGVFVSPRASADAAS